MADRVLEAKLTWWLKRLPDDWPAVRRVRGEHFESCVFALEALEQEPAELDPWAMSGAAHALSTRDDSDTFYVEASGLSRQGGLFEQPASGRGWTRRLHGRQQRWMREHGEG